jgi:hypothetical protein
VPATSPVMVHEETATAVHDALPGIARATYVVLGCGFCHDATALFTAAATCNCSTRTVDAGTCSNRFGDCWVRALLKYVTTFNVALPSNHVHAAVGPVAKLLGAASCTCRYRATAPSTNQLRLFPAWKQACLSKQNLLRCPRQQQQRHPHS